MNKRNSTNRFWFMGEEIQSEFCRGWAERELCIVRFRIKKERGMSRVKDDDCEKATTHCVAFFLPFNTGIVLLFVL